MLNLIVFLALTLGWAMYGYQMSLGIKALYDKFNISHTGTIIGGFVGSFACAAVVMHILILIRGAEGAWYLFVYFVVQAGIATMLSYRTVKAQIAIDEGVKYTAEPIVGPLIFGAAYAFLLLNMQDILYP
ncbi:MAG: hypothetical protein CMN53_02610 [SAR116 cluster bacterium]|nr:hypothetical protein [SAR116 cluster bacterium]